MGKKIQFDKNRVLRWTIYAILLVTIVLSLIACFAAPSGPEASVGSFDSTEFNEGWTLTGDGEPKTISLPYEIHSDEVDTLTLTKTLPFDLHDGMSLMTRSFMSDMYISIDNVLRESFATENFAHMSHYIPSAYQVVELSAEDAGKQVSITLHPKTTVHIGEVYIANGNNGWFRIIKKHLPSNSISLVILILGVILTIVSRILRRISDIAGKGYYLGIMMIDISIWEFSESHLRQLIFSIPSMIQYLSYMSLELLIPLACLYFDSVQGKKHHKSYFFIEVASILQLIVNIILNFTGTVDFYQTLSLSHLWLILGIVFAIINIISDIRTGYILNYPATAVGMVVLLSTGVIELALFHTLRYYNFGFIISLGLIFLSAATVIDLVLDQMRKAKDRESEQNQMIVRTIESIATAIDAKDSYTGGHSERVSRYTTILAGKVADRYGFSERDIQRFRYIGLMHDIGKIGVPASVLNKPGKLNDTEYELMKKHVDIGAEILSGIGDLMPGLLDGILYHHERYNGKGYPKGLSGEQIPLIARILCIADCYDAMTSNRIYRSHLNDQTVRDELMRCSGSDFDPDLVRVFVHLLDSGELKPDTIDGMAMSNHGEPLKSSILEKRIQELAATGTTLNHPEHASMLCFLIKLREKNGEHIDVFLLQFLDESGRKVIDQIKPLLTSKDMCIGSDDSYAIVSIVNRTAEEIEAIQKLLSSAPGVSAEHL